MDMNSYNGNFFIDYIVFMIIKMFSHISLNVVFLINFSYKHYNRRTPTEGIPLMFENEN